MSTAARRAILPVCVWTLLTLITLLPIYWMFLVSGRNRVEMFGRPTLWMKSFHWDNYLIVLGNETFRGYMVNSLIVATSNALLVTTLALLATFALSRFKLGGQDSIFFWTITNRMAPAAVFLLPLFLLFTQVFVIGDWKLYDTKLGLILLYCVFNLPFAIWLLKGMIDGIPQGARRGGDARRLQHLPDPDQGHRAAGPARPRRHRDPVPGCSPGTSICSRPRSPAPTPAPSPPAWPNMSPSPAPTGASMAAIATLTLLPALVFLGFVQRHIVAGLTFGALKE